jgi:hypothetical protein
MDDEPQEIGPAKPKKQAVVLIHGIGEQRPMATLWKLVHTVWSREPRDDGKTRAVFSEPDDLSGIFELRRLSTNENIHGKRTDFFEFYWAHLMYGNDFGHVVRWLARLALRNRSEVPQWLMKPWMWLQAPLVLAVLVFAVFAIAVLHALIMQRPTQFLFEVSMFILIVWAGLLVADKLFLSPVVGDAARYLSSNPGDIQRRQEIRKKGLDLLEDLHRCGKYDRIILVGHSLGGVIGYDMLMHMWGRRHRRMDQCVDLALAIKEAEAAGAELLLRADDETHARWRRAQRAVFDALRVGADPHWIISDFVTLGAPLAHAQTLMAETMKEFQAALERREHAANPPQFEAFANGVKRFSYCRSYGRADDAEAEPRAPHNGAVFCAVRWTNIYFPAEGILRGDLVGGPAGPVFGPGVIDTPARAPKYKGWTPHLQYFHLEADPRPWGDPTWVDHREALREGIALEDLEACWPGRQIPSPHLGWRAREG